jgi:hypothetical protein
MTSLLMVEVVEAAEAAKTTEEMDWTKTRL